MGHHSPGKAAAILWHGWAGKDVDEPKQKKGNKGWPNADDKKIERRRKWARITQVISRRENKLFRSRE